MDILISRLPKYVSQFAPTSEAPHPSLFRCGPAAGAMCLDFAYPNKYDPYLIEHQEYVKLVGPDVASDQQGVTNAIMLKFFADYHIGVVDMQHLVDQGLQHGNYGPLYAEIEAQNRQGIIQFLSVADESLLIDDATGASLHPGLHYGHCIVRLGFSDDAGYGLYYDPAAPAQCTDPKTGKNVPVHISWSDSMAKAHINSCFAIMPPGVSVPPAGFSFQSGKWPAPKPTVDVDKILSTVGAMQQAIAAMASATQNLAADLKTLQGEV
jgi:hypothetical protein